MRRLLLAAASRRSSAASATAASLPAAPSPSQRPRISVSALARGISVFPSWRMIRARDDEPSSAPGRSAPEDSEKDAQREFVRWDASDEELDEELAFRSDAHPAGGSLSGAEVMLARLPTGSRGVDQAWRISAMQRGAATRIGVPHTEDSPTEEEEEEEEGAKSDWQPVLAGEDASVAVEGSWGQSEDTYPESLRQLWSPGEDATPREQPPSARTKKKRSPV